MVDQASTVLLVLSEAGTGGMQAMVGLLAGGLRQSGIEVHIAAGGDSPMPGVVNDVVASGGVLLHRLPDPHGLGLLSWTRALRKVVHTVRPSIVHGHGLRTAWPIALAAGRRRSLVTCHGLPPDDLARSARLVARSGVQAAAVGPGLVDDLRRAGLSTWLIENGVAPAPSPMSRTDLETELGIDATVPLVIQAARLSPQKDPLLAGAAVARLEGVELLLLGGGPLESEVQTRALELGVRNRVHMSPWRADARAILGAGDVALLSSRWEGQPLVVVEAAAGGVPVVATSCPGVGDWLVSGREALLSPVGDVSALASNLGRVLGDASLRAQLVEAGAVLARSHTIDTMVAAHVRRYEELVAS